MSKMNLFVESNDALSPHTKAIEAAVKAAEEYVFSRLKIDWDIDVLVCSSKQESPNTEDRVSGHTYESNLIRLIAEDGFKEFEISEVLVHELCHAARWGKNNEWMKTLFDVLIFEGLAVCFTEGFSKNNNNQQSYMKIILNRSDEENEKILNSLKAQFYSADYDYEYIFRNNESDLPLWAGYSLGYYLVKKYLEKTNKTIEEIFSDKYTDIEAAIQSK